MSTKSTTSSGTDSLSGNTVRLTNNIIGDLRRIFPELRIDKRLVQFNRCPSHLNHEILMSALYREIARYRILAALITPSVSSLVHSANNPVFVDNGTQTLSEPERNVVNHDQFDKNLERVIASSAISCHVRNSTETVTSMPALGPTPDAGRNLLRTVSCPPSISSQLGAIRQMDGTPSPLGSHLIRHGKTHRMISVPISVHQQSAPDMNDSNNTTEKSVTLTSASAECLDHTVLYDSNVPCSSDGLNSSSISVGVKKKRSNTDKPRKSKKMKKKRTNDD